MAMIIARVFGVGASLISGAALISRAEQLISTVADKQIEQLARDLELLKIKNPEEEVRKRTFLVWWQDINEVCKEYSAEELYEQLETLEAHGPYNNNRPIVTGSYSRALFSEERRYKEIIETVDCRYHLTSTDDNDEGMVSQCEFLKKCLERKIQLKH